MFIFIFCTGAYAVGAGTLINDYERKKRKGGKLDCRWFGPYKIEKLLEKGLYMIKKQKKLEKSLTDYMTHPLSPICHPYRPM